MPDWRDSIESAKMYHVMYCDSPKVQLSVIMCI